MSVNLETLVLARKYVDDLISGGIGGATENNYNLLSNKPKINNIELKGNILSNELNLINAITDEEINSLFKEEKEK